MKASELWTWPNAITAYRVVICVPIVLLLVGGTADSLWMAFALMVIAELSDAIDGHLARRLSQVSTVGKIFDPLADSLYRVSVFMALVANHWMPVWMLLVIVWRDLAVAYLRVVGEETSGTIGARQSGKWKAAAQGAAQLLVVLAHAVWGATVPSGVELALWLVLLLATVVTASSLIDYAMGVLRAARQK